MLHHNKNVNTSFYDLMVFVIPISLAVLYSNALFSNSQAIAQTLTEPSSNYLRYTDANYGVTIQYPADWQKRQSSENFQTLINDFLVTLGPVNFESIATFEPVDLSVAVDVSVEKLPENMTLDQYAEQVITNQRSYHSDFQVIEQNKSTTTAGVQGYNVVLNGTVDLQRIWEISNATEIFGQPMNFKPVTETKMMFITIQGNNVYTIDYSDFSSGFAKQFCKVFGELLPDCPLFTSKEDPFSFYLPIAEQMIHSFEIIGVNQTIHNDTSLTVRNETGQYQPNYTQPTNEDNCSIIDRRLAEGNIQIEEYERLREILNC